MDTWLHQSWHWWVSIHLGLRAALRATPICEVVVGIRAGSGVDASGWYCAFMHRSYRSPWMQAIVAGDRLSVVCLPSTALCAWFFGICFARVLLLASLHMQFRDIQCDQGWGCLCQDRDIFLHACVTTSRAHALGRPAVPDCTCCRRGAL